MTITAATGRSSINDHYNSNSPSFSSTLLDQIDHSFEDSNNKSQSMKSSAKKSTYMDRFAVDQWIENEKINLRRKNTLPAMHCDRRQINHSSSTSSSGSSSGLGGFSSSDTESMHRSANRKQKPTPILKPIRTTPISPEFVRKRYSDGIPTEKKKQNKEGNLQRRALKLYRELKKVKKPISPGGKLTSFLNSLFHSGTSMKKTNISSPAPSYGCRKLETESSPMMMTSRSCLSKTPSSEGRIHRSVRFLDDNNSQSASRSNRHVDKSLCNELKCDVEKRHSSILADDEVFKLQIREKQRRVEEVAKEILKNYHHLNRKELKVNIIPETRTFVHTVTNFEEYDDEDDEISCGSSDLFELENILEIGMDVDELPVYETTHVGTNTALANGFIL